MRDATGWIKGGMLLFLLLSAFAGIVTAGLQPQEALRHVSSLETIEVAATGERVGEAQMSGQIPASTELGHLRVRRETEFRPGPLSTARLDLRLEGCKTEPKYLAAAWGLVSAWTIGLEEVLRAVFMAFPPDSGCEATITAPRWVPLPDDQIDALLQAGRWNDCLASPNCRERARAALEGGEL